MDQIIQPKIDICLSDLFRDMRLERQTGIHTISATLKVVYPLGEFELTVQAQPSARIDTEIVSAIQRAVVEFADQLKESARSHIRAPGFPLPTEN